MTDYSAAETLISKDMSDTMTRLTKIERLVEELLCLRQEMVEFDRKRNYNRECLGAFRRGEIQTNSKLWMQFSTATGATSGGNLFVKLPRKNLVGILEGEQVRLGELIERNRGDVREKVRTLNQIEPDMLGGEMDPYVLELLLRERKGVVKEEEDEEGSD